MGWMRFDLSVFVQKFKEVVDRMAGIEKPFFFEEWSSFFFVVDECTEPSSLLEEMVDGAIYRLFMQLSFIILKQEINNAKKNDVIK